MCNISLPETLCYSDPCSPPANHPQPSTLQKGLSPCSLPRFAVRPVVQARRLRGRPADTGTNGLARTLP